MLNIFSFLVPWVFSCLTTVFVLAQFSYFGEASLIQSFIMLSSIGQMGHGSMLEGIKAAVKQQPGTENWQRHSFKYPCKCLGSHMAFIFPLPVFLSSSFHSGSNH